MKLYTKTKIIVLWIFIESSGLSHAHTRERR
jgi:hypothetical protein